MSLTRTAEVTIGGATGANITIVEVAPDNTIVGAVRVVVNQTKTAVVAGDRGILGQMSNGQVFFLGDSGTAVCGPGDCPDSCSTELLCFALPWTQGFNVGIFYVDVLVQNCCIHYGEPAGGCDPQGSGSVTDPATGRVWNLSVIWDYCFGTGSGLLSDCAGGAIIVDDLFGGIISGTPCGNDIVFGPLDFFGAGPCSNPSTFPCCGSAEGCDCGT